MRCCWILALGLFVVGCGGKGGGGGGSTGGSNLGDTCPGLPSGKLDYATSWGTVPADASQVILIKDAAGNVVRSDALNRGGKPTSTLPIVTLPSGVYELRVVLYSMANAGGAPLKELSSVLGMCGTSNTVTVRTIASENVKSLTVNPGVATLTQNQTKRFVAVATGPSGNPAFVPFGSVKWSVQGGIGTVSANGVFTAVTPGTGKVQAGIASLAMAARADVTVQKFTAVKGKWTVLVFMNAANNLQPDSDLNVNQMESVAGNPDVRFVVQWKESKAAFAGSTFDGVRRYLVKPDNDMNQVNSELVQDNLVDLQGNPLDMGKASTLLDFVKWGKSRYPADRYVLVVWNHGNGWQRRPEDGGTRGFSYDDQYGTHIDTWQIDQALLGESFDIIAWDASLMQMAEVAYEARNHADFIAGSEESPPAEGYPYQDVFKGFRDLPDASTSALAKGFVDGMVNNPLYANRKITQSVIDTSKLAALATAMDTFGRQLFANKAALATLIAQTRNGSQSYSQTPTRFYNDIVDLCAMIEADGTIPLSVRNASVAVRNAVAASVVWEGHNTHSPGSNGVSVDFSEGSLFQTYRPDYIQLKWAKDTFWDEFLGAAP